MAVVGPYVRMTLLIADESGVEHAALRQPNPDVSRIVFIIHVDEFENLAAEAQGQVVVEGHDGVHRMKIFKRLFAFRKALAPRLDQVRLPTLPVLRYSLMHDHRRRRRKERRDRKSTRLNSSHDQISY